MESCCDGLFFHQATKDQVQHAFFTSFLFFHEQITGSMGTQGGTGSSGRTFPITRAKQQPPKVSAMRKGLLLGGREAATGPWSPQQPEKCRSTGAKLPAFTSLALVPLWGLPSLTSTKTTMTLTLCVTPSLACHPHNCSHVEKHWWCNHFLDVTTSQMMVRLFSQLSKWSRTPGNPTQEATKPHPNPDLTPARAKHKPSQLPVHITAGRTHTSRAPWHCPEGASVQTGQQHNLTVAIKLSLV